LHRGQSHPKEFLLTFLLTLWKNIFGWAECRSSPSQKVDGRHRLPGCRRCQVGVKSRKASAGVTSAAAFSVCASILGKEVLKSCRPCTGPSGTLPNPARFALGPCETSACSQTLRLTVTVASRLSPSCARRDRRTRRCIRRRDHSEKSAGVLGSPRPPPPPPLADTYRNGANSLPRL